MDGVQIVDLKGQIIFSNKAVEEIYGYSAAELVGRHVNEMNVDPVFAEREILPVLREKGHWNGELMVRHKDGHEFPIWLSAAMVRNDDDAPIAMIGLIKDITERKRAEDVLRESENRFRGAFENAAVGATMVDLKGKFIKVNRRICKMLGYREEELVGKTFSDVTHPDDIQIGLDHMRRMTAGEIEFASFEKRYIRKDGGIIYLIISPSVIKDSQGRPQYFVGLFQDITERKQIEEQLRKYREHLEELVRDDP
jgi:PAS domain S-box-containing protein